MTNKEVLRFLEERVPVFESFGEQRLSALLEKSRIATFEPHEAIIEFGEEGTFLGVLLDGEAEVSVTDDGGDRHSLGILSAGDLFGELSLMTGDRTSADVVGVSRCRAVIIPQDLFSDELITHPPAVRYLSKVISDRLRGSRFDESGIRRETAALKRGEDPYGFRLKTEHPARILVINCGSSSLKFELFNTNGQQNDVHGIIELNDECMLMRYRHKEAEYTRDLKGGSHSEAVAAVFSELTENPGVIRSVSEISAVGHRVVHGGERFRVPELITDEILEEIEKLSTIAPLHNPANLAGIRAARDLLPDVPHVAVFDTAFHHTIPPYACLYGLPYEYYEKEGIRRYGFHGMSHMYVGLTAAQFLKRAYNELEIITCHLGNGASVCAVDHGRSVDTSMGFTPAEGLIMGTRCGDIDPGALVHIARTRHMDADGLDRLINRDGGLKGISGISNDMREVESAADSGDHRALLAVKTFCYRVRKYIGAYTAAMGGLDVVVFTGGIGQGSAGIRRLACQGLSCMGIRIDDDRNRRADGNSPARISTEDSSVEVLVVPTDEERMIAREVLRTLARERVSRVLTSGEPLPVPIEISAHHVHLSEEHVEALFGAGHELKEASELSQPGQFACKEMVSLVGPKGRVERVRVLGPTRKQSQIEISMTEQFKLGIYPPVRESGDLRGTPGITLEGPVGSVMLTEGVICAMRHIHMSPEDALRFGLRDRYVVRVRIEGDRELVFGDVLVRVRPDFRSSMHLDTDEANAANIKQGVIGYIDGIQERG